MRAAVALAALIGQGYALPAIVGTLGWLLGVLWALLDEKIMADAKFHISGGYIMGNDEPSDGWADQHRRSGRIGGVKVVSDEEAEKADICVCMPVGPSRFNDNELGACADCGCAIMFRPTNPKKPIKVCVDCGMRRAGISEEEIARHREGSKGA